MFNRLTLIVLIAVPHIQAAASSSSDTLDEDQIGAPSLQRKALQAFIGPPSKIAEVFDKFNPQLQFESFIETVNNALGSRLGLQVLASSNQPLKEKKFPMQFMPPQEHHLTAFDAFNNHSSMVAVTDEENSTTGLINTLTGDLIWQVDGKFKAFSPDGSLAAVSIENAAGKNETRLINTATGDLIHKIEGGFKGFSPNGTVVARVVRNPAGRNLQTHLINRVTGRLIRQIDGNFWGFSPDGSLVAVYTRNDETRLINTVTGKLIRQIEGIFKAFSPDGSLVAVYTRNDETRLINIVTGELMHQIDGEFQAFSPDGSMVAVSDNDETSLINTVTGELMRQVDGELAGFSPDGSLIVVSDELDAWDEGYEYKIRLINIESGALIVEDMVHHPHDFKFSPDGNLFAVLLNDIGGEAETKLFNAKTGELILYFDGLIDAFSPDGTMMLIFLDNGQILNTADFSNDLMKISDIKTQKFLLSAAQAWVDKKAYKVSADDPNYLSVIKQIPYLNNPLLFEPIVTLQSLYADVRKQLDDYALRVYDPNDQQLKDLTLRTFDAWYDLQKSQDTLIDDNAVYIAFMRTLKPRSPAWIVLRQHGDALTNNYAFNRAQREAQRVQRGPTSRPKRAVACESASSDVDGSASSSSTSSSEASSSSEVRAPDAPVTMRLFDDADEYQVYKKRRL